MQADDSERVALIAVYDRLDDAQRARERLLEDGVLAPDDVSIDFPDDEAGPTSGNFVTGNGRDHAADPYRENFAAPTHASTCVMTLIVDRARIERAGEIARSCGARIAP